MIECVSGSRSPSLVVKENVFEINVLAQGIHVNAKVIGAMFKVPRVTVELEGISQRMSKKNNNLFPEELKSSGPC